MEAETVAVLLFTATIAVLVGYAARRRWSSHRKYTLEYTLEGGSPRLEVTGTSSEEQERLIEEWLRSQGQGGLPDDVQPERPGRRNPPIDVQTEPETRDDPGFETVPETRIEEAVVVHASARPDRAGILSRVRMIHVITLLFLLASFWIILSNRYDDDVQKWAFGAMGSILGFWLGPGRD